VVRALKPVTYVRPAVTLDAAQVAAYAKVCGFKPEAGVPVLYPQMLTFPLAMEFFASEHCPWPAMGTVHLANRIHQHRQLSVGDLLRVEMRTGELLAHEKGQVFTLEFAISREGERVWDGTMTALRIGVKNPVGKPYVSALSSDANLSCQAGFTAPADIGRRYGLRLPPGHCPRPVDQGPRTGSHVAAPADRAGRGDGGIQDSAVPARSGLSVGHAPGEGHLSP